MGSKCWLALGGLGVCVWSSSERSRNGLHVVASYKEVGFRRNLKLKYWSCFASFFYMYISIPVLVCSYRYRYIHISVYLCNVYDMFIECLYDMISFIILCSRMCFSVYGRALLSSHLISDL